MRHILHKGTALAVAVAILSGYVLPVIPRAYGAAPAVVPVVVAAAPTAAQFGTALGAAAATYGALTLSGVQEQLSLSPSEFGSMLTLGSALHLQAGLDMWDLAEYRVAGTVAALHGGMVANGTWERFREVLPSTLADVGGYAWLRTADLLGLLAVAPAVVAPSHITDVVATGHFRSHATMPSSHHLAPGTLVNVASMTRGNLTSQGLTDAGLQAVLAFMSGQGLAASGAPRGTTWSHTSPTDYIRLSPWGQVSFAGMALNIPATSLNVRYIWTHPASGDVLRWHVDDVAAWNNVGAITQQAVPRNVTVGAAALGAAALWPKVANAPRALLRQGAAAVDWAKRRIQFPNLGKIPRWVPPFIAGGVWDWAEGDDEEVRTREAADRVPDGIESLPTPAREMSSWLKGPIQAILNSLASLQKQGRLMREWGERTLFKAFSPNGQQLQLDLWPKYQGIGEKLQKAAPFGFVALAVAAIAALRLGFLGNSPWPVDTSANFMLTDHGPEISFDLVNTFNTVFADYRWALEVAVWVVFLVALVRLVRPHIGV